MSGDEATITIERSSENITLIFIPSMVLGKQG